MDLSDFNGKNNMLYEIWEKTGKLSEVEERREKKVQAYPNLHF